ncbi:MAG TPA: aminoglycoside adenylyltransferase domain-containing protein [Longimicrobium sp.]
MLSIQPALGDTDLPTEPGPPARPQSWPACDADVRAWVDATVDALRRHLARELTGIYLHGSLATGAYRRPKSDVDLIVIVREHPDDDRLRALAGELAALHERRPSTGELELRIVRDADVRPFASMAPGFLAFSPGRGDWIGRNEVPQPGLPNLELASVAAAARERGIALHGPPPREGIAPVPWAAYVASVMDDFAWIVEGEHVLVTPFYAVLNLCRTLAMLTEGEGSLLVDKEEGARWALAHLPPEHHPVISRALAAYVSSDEVTAEQRRTAGLRWDRAPLLAFRDFAAAEAARLGFSSYLNQG